MNRAPFALFRSPLDLAHRYWQEIVMPGDVVVDATCGNGKDASFLAQLALREDKGRLFAFDIQPQAIQNTESRLKQLLAPSSFSRVALLRESHARLLSFVSPHAPKLIAYNLGYLPGGGNKAETTKTETTLQSLEQATALLADKGAISVVCYPGHPEGKIEEEAVLAFASRLDPRRWNCCFHRWINRDRSPGLLFLQKAEGN